jgi:hypothetical protein
LESDDGVAGEKPPQPYQPGRRLIPTGSRAGRHLTGEKTMRVYCSKFAMTAGIVVRETDEAKGDMKPGAYVYLKNGGRGIGDQRVVGRDVHLTFGDAYAAAEKARLKRIASLEKQLKAVRALVFKEPQP